MAGFDTASQIGAVQVQAVEEFGTPRFWGRYFSPCQSAGTGFEQNALSEARAMWNSGSRHLFPLTSPTQGHLAGTTAMGQSDAKTFVGAVTSGIAQVAPMQWPSGLYTYLDQEYSTSLSITYWNGWARYVDDNFGSHVALPALYCTPDAPYPNCSVVTSSQAAICYGIWSAEPEPCGNLVNPPAWGPQTCGSGKMPTILWQYGEHTGCGFTSNVDLDLGGPTGSAFGGMFYLSSQP